MIRHGACIEVEGVAHDAFVPIDTAHVIAHELIDMMNNEPELAVVFGGRVHCLECDVKEPTPRPDDQVKPPPPPAPPKPKDIWGAR